MVSGELTEEQTPQSFTELFDNAFPTYLFYGMSYDQFWHDDVRLVVAYRKAHKMRNQAKNQELWLQGLYFYNALCAVAPVLVAMPKRGATIEPYIKEPIPITEEEVHDKQEREQKAMAEKLKQYMMMKGGG